ncbi:hypothetical protein L210DRAFT_3548224 [Boletus edulis BED1]|uniref:Uncharacterized protein n=1 Tax=Boletus edulis BED1 TaxID=1328754 RepID=A0AAD4BP53_BOLED|nr:hypothetical protein L210DRAFT_3548224 [Boletus edulis BED1]
MWPLLLTPLTVVKLGVILLGMFNLALMLQGRQYPLLHPRSSSITKPRETRIRSHPSLQLLHLDTHSRTRTRTLFTEETVHYPINGTLADLEWASLVPAGNNGLVLLGQTRTYAIVAPPPKTVQARYHVHHCFNYLRQMILCAANTRLNPTNHMHPSGKLASDGIGLTYQCRDWDAVYEAFEANYALNRTISFAI